MLIEYQLFALTVCVIVLCSLFILWYKPKKKPSPKKEQPKNPINKNYVCLGSDPINTINDLRQGDWNMAKVQDSLAMGILRYARESEIEEAKKIGRV